MDQIISILRNESRDSFVGMEKLKKVGEFHKPMVEITLISKIDGPKDSRKKGIA
jgi:hypothetical protein